MGTTTNVETHYFMMQLPHCSSTSAVFLHHRIDQINVLPNEDSSTLMTSGDNKSCE